MIEDKKGGFFRDSFFFSLLLAAFLGRGRHELLISRLFRWERHTHSDERWPFKGLISFYFLASILTNTTHATLFFSAGNYRIPFRKQKKKTPDQRMVVGDRFTNKEASTKFRLFEMWLSKMVSKGVETSSSIAFEANLQRTFFAGCCKWLGSVSATEIVPSHSLWTLLRPRTSSCILVANGEGHFWQGLEVRFWCGLVFPS
mgnify:CR=1 FL=1